MKRCDPHRPSGAARVGSCGAGSGHDSGAQGAYLLLHRQNFLDPQAEFLADFYSHATADRFVVDHQFQRLFSVAGELYDTSGRQVHDIAEGKHFVS